MRCTSLRKASIEHGMAIVTTTVTTPLYVTSEATTIPKNKTNTSTNIVDLTATWAWAWFLIPISDFVRGKSLLTSTPN